MKHTIAIFYFLFFYKFLETKLKQDREFIINQKQKF